MTDEPKHLKRGEAPRILQRLRLAFGWDLMYRTSRPEVREAMHSAMTIAEVRARYGLPDQIADSKIEAVVAEVTRDRAEARPRFLVAVRMRDRKALHVEAIEPAEPGDMKRKSANYETALKAASSALSATVGKRGKTVIPAPKDAKPGYALYAVEGLDPEAPDIGPVVTRRGRLVARFVLA